MTQFPLKRKQNWNNSGDVKSTGLVKIWVGKQSGIKKQVEENTQQKQWMRPVIHKRTSVG